MTAVTVGTFDLLHFGHKQLLRRASRFGELFVGVNSDRFVEEYKGRSPEQPEDFRRGMVDMQPCVAGVVINDGPGDELIRFFKPDYLVIGSDWLEKDYLEQIRMTPEELFEKLGVSLVFVPRTPGVSSSELRA